jgi:hypothetical protein
MIGRPFLGSGLKHPKHQRLRKLVAASTVVVESKPLLSLFAGAKLVLSVCPDCGNNQEHEGRGRLVPRGEFVGWALGGELQSH